MKWLLFMHFLHLVTEAADRYWYTTHSIDGKNNNRLNPQWGARNTPRIRCQMNGTTSFLDGISIPVDEINSNLPSARRIMENIFRFPKPNKDKTMSHMVLELGHFIAHDIMSGPNRNVNKSEPFDIPCDGNLTDLMFCPVTGKYYNASDVVLSSMPFFRQKYVISSTSSSPRETFQGQTHWLDLSNVYGHTFERVSEMRDGLDGGLLKLENDLVPQKNIDFVMNASPGVFSLYVVFIRYHNFVAREFAKNDPKLTNDELFYLARQKTIAVYQSFVEEKYIPTVIGNTLDPHKGYNETVNPNIDEFFASIGFRYAHSSFSNVVQVIDKDMIPTDSLSLRDVFNQSEPNKNVLSLVERYGGIEPFLRGLAIVPAKAVDASIVDDLNIWSEATSVLDVQRARDVGIPLYNNARVELGLNPMETMEDLVKGYSINSKVREGLLERLNILYHSNVSLVDAYVGSLIEPPLERNQDFLGPLLTKSIKDQFTRLRDGDRFWYKNIFSREEYEAFPSMTKVIQAVCLEMEQFPEDSFSLFDPSTGHSKADIGTCNALNSQISILGGSLRLDWQIKNSTSTIDVKMRFEEGMDGNGFIGVGWGSKVMLGAEIWFCTIDEEVFSNYPPGDNDCIAPSAEPNSTKRKMFSCCVTPGINHAVPQCASQDDEIFYSLQIVNWCLSKSFSSVTVRAPVCSSKNNEDNSKTSPRNCFRLSSTQDFIMAYNPSAQSRTHGFQRRTAAQVDLYTGSQTEPETKTADEGLIALHGIHMLFSWMILAPVGIFIVRHMKTKKWRMVAHISIMGIIGSLVVPLLVGVEASVGATSAISEHKVVGLSLLVVYFLMVAAGRVRYLKLTGSKVGRRTDVITHFFHRYMGLAIVFLSWWNCYTGLVRIGPEDISVQLFIMGSKAIGYDIAIFARLRRHIFFPYLGCVLLIFLIAEFRLHQSKRATHDNNEIDSILEGSKTIWEDDGSELDIMTIENFLYTTRHSALCVVDGRVLDLTDFMEIHPGGKDFMKYAQGSDITAEILGRRDIDGIKHTHGQGALKLMNSLVKAKLEKSGEDKIHKGRGGITSLISRPTHLVKSIKSKLMYTPGRVVSVKCITPSLNIGNTSRPVIWLRLAVPRDQRESRQTNASLTPSSAFTFRGRDKQGRQIERQYTPIILCEKYQELWGERDWSRRRRTLANMVSYRSFSKAFKGSDGTSEEEIYDFIISLVPNGQMSKYLLCLKPGKNILCQGPLTSQSVVQKLKRHWETIVMVAAGTGVSPMLQLVDDFIARNRKQQHRTLEEKERGGPCMFLVWLVEGPQQNYSKLLGLNQRVAESNGHFFYTIIYSTSKTPSTSNSDLLNPGVAKGSAANRRASLTDINLLYKAKHILKSRFSEQSMNVKDLIESSRGKSATILGGSLVVEKSSDGESYCRNFGSQINVDLWRKNGQQLSLRINHLELKHLLDSICNYLHEQQQEMNVLSAPNNTSTNYSSNEVSLARDKGCNSFVAGELIHNIALDSKMELEVPETLQAGSFALDKDIERGSLRESKYSPEKLLVISGSPTFELYILGELRKIYFPREQVMSFLSSKDTDDSGSSDDDSGCLDFGSSIH
mmetsp:Transcript_22791/g.25964  ORF Transcript_22791/g.25964 Transcript_22791/m.25964 type:complete len:1587 (-) Transcript_22791:233-4993(-)